jgi:hypothetical protein
LTGPGGDPNGAPMKKIILILTALAFATPASAEWSRTWSCDNGMIDVTLVKHATKAFELNFSGKLPVVWAYRDGKPEKAFDFRFVGKDGAIFNGKLCKLVEEPQ